MCIEVLLDWPVLKFGYDPFVFPDLTCDFPARVEHGDFVRCSEAGKSMATYFCHHGYKLQGEEHLSCTKGVWNSEPPICQGAGI